MTTLIVPLICECGYATLSAEAAVRHIKEQHPGLWAETFPEAETTP